MNAHWNAATGAAIGAQWLLAAIAPASDFGRRVRATERTFRIGDEAAATSAIARVADVARGLGEARLAALHDALCRAPDVGGILARASAGAILDDVDFFEVGRFADAVAGVVARIAGTALAGTIDGMPADVVSALSPGRGPGGAFFLADAFDDGLVRAREAAAVARARYDAARGRALATVTAAVGEVVRDGAFVLARDRAPQPLPPGVRVVREAPTYLACEIVADDATIAARDAVDRGDAAVAACEETVRERLSRAIARAAPALARACVALGELDSLVARARFACRYDAVVPEIAYAATAAFTGARYLPFAIAAAVERPYVPLDLELAGVGVVTGPNMGGKTAALRTLGLLVACVAAGVPVPARAATLPLVDEIVWLGIDAGPADGALLSAFGAEAVDLRDLLRRGAARPLVLLDEFARTTSPREGRALLVATIARLRETGALGLAATHLDGVALASGAPHFAIGRVRSLGGGDAESDDLDVALARIARATDYRLRSVAESVEPRSGALALAEALGLDATLVARARDALEER